MSFVKLRKLLDQNRLRGDFILMSRETAEDFGIDTSKLPVVVPGTCDQCYFCDTVQYPDRTSKSRCDHPVGGGFSVDSSEAPPPSCPFRNG